MSKEQLEIKHCYHCGEDAKSDKLEFDDHLFCCLGCKGAYELLNQNNLCDYYDIDKNPGNNLKNTIDPTEYSFLDEESIKRKLLLFSDGNQAKVTLKLPQIHCSSCIWLLENLQSLNEGIVSSRVNFSKKSIHITFNETETTLRKVVELLANFGYVPEINLKSSDDKSKLPIDKSLYYKLGVAGFCFGNIMLMSFPEYIGISGDFDNEFQTLFRWANAALSIPVLFYSGSDYLQNALNAVKTRIINLDVPIVLGMLALFVRSWYEVATLTGAGYFDSLVGFIFFLLLGKYFQTKTYSHLSFERDFKSFFPLAVLQKGENGFKPTEITKLNVADIIMVKSGQIVPCDAILLGGDTQIDYSFVTGESVPVSKQMGDLIYAGGKQVGGAIELLVEKRVEESYLTELWQKEKATVNNNGVAEIADKVGKYFTYTILTVAIFTLIYWSFFSIETAFLAFTSVLIVACPCALALSVPFTQGTAMRWLAKHGFFIKKSGLLEKIGSLTHVVFDKTGTLTHSKNAKVEYSGKPISIIGKELKSLVHQSSHPLSIQINDSLKDTELTFKVFDFEEFEGLGISGTVNGKKLSLGSEKFILGSNGLESGANVLLKIDNEFFGVFKFKLAYREGFSHVLKSLQESFEVSLVSGDQSSEFENLRKHFVSAEKLKFNQKPHDKKDYILYLKSQGARVAMVGDGLNDAGALMASDLGISVTDDVNNFTPASDVIIKGNVLVDLPKIFSFSRKTQKIIYVAFAISFAYNILGLSFAVQGLLSPIVSAILMPLSSITVVVFTTISTSLLAKKMNLV